MLVTEPMVTCLALYGKYSSSALCRIPERLISFISVLYLWSRLSLYRGRPDCFRGASTLERSRVHITLSRRTRRHNCSTVCQHCKPTHLRKGSGA